MKFKKGSKAAKDYMAKIRAKRGKVGAAPKKKAPAKKAAQKKAAKAIKTELKNKGLKLPHGYGVEKRARINGIDTNLKLTPSGYGHFKVSMQYYGKTISCITSNMPAVDDYNSEDGDRRRLKGFKALKAEVIRKNKF